MKNSVFVYYTNVDAMRTIHFAHHIKTIKLQKPIDFTQSYGPAGCSAAQADEGVCRRSDGGVLYTSTDRKERNGNILITKFPMALNSTVGLKS